MKVDFLIGIKPGKLHLGHYIGNLKPFFEKILNKLNSLKTKESYDNINVIYIANYHLFSQTDINASIINQYTENTINIISKIIKVKCNENNILNKSNIVILKQSDIIKELDLWKISSITNISKLNRIFKLNKYTEKNNLCTFLYPILMALDIIALNPNNLIVGIDQKINVEFFQEIYLKAFKVKSNLKIIFNKRILDLYKPDIKMSKSVKSNGIIYLEYNQNEFKNLLNQIKKIPTNNNFFSSIEMLNHNDMISFDNLLNICCSLNNKTKKESFLNQQYQEIKQKAFKIIQTFLIKINNQELLNQNEYLIDPSCNFIIEIKKNLINFFKKLNYWKVN